MWAYFPLLHSEDLEDQELSLASFVQLEHDLQESQRLNPVERGRLIGTAQAHLESVRRFRRLPERNRIMGRESTPQELQWLEVNPTS